MPDPQAISIRDRALQLLREGVGRADATFHEHQWESISQLVEERRRLLVVQRTGWGKSAVYFIATKLIREQGRGPTIILSPLLALMRNQIDSAAAYGVRLGTINSAISQDEIVEVETALEADELDAIIISPERLANAKFVETVLLPMASRVGLLVIDEAHCISDWGHDFRPDYKRIIGILGFLPRNMPVLATTATANQRVMEDVATQLGGNPDVLRGRLTRDSLHLQSIHLSKRSQRLAWLSDTLPQLEGTGIIYVATTRDAELVAGWLKHRGIEAEAYYGSLKGMKTEEVRKERLRREEALLNNKVKALVATSALGMGYDKPDLSFVIHFQSPGSVVSYYQQVGRAGRGIPSAYGVLLSGSEDDEIQNHFINNAFPEERLVETILDLLGSSEEGLSSREIEERTNGRSGKIKAALTFLAAESPAPILRESTRYRRTLIDYAMPHEAIGRIVETKRREWIAMQSYLGHDDCLMEFLAAQLDDPAASRCGKCKNCAPEVSLPATYAHETGLAAAEFLENVLIEIQPRVQAGPSKDGVLKRFSEYQFPAKFGELEHEPGRALCRWGEAGWGEIAMKGKSDGRFDERLVGAATKLIRERWKPEPAPTWVAFVPSHLRLGLVPPFARALAQDLGLPCVDVIRKVKRNDPQKEMENSHHRCTNLDGVFEVIAPPHDGAVLLIDDAVDSGWTFAVLAALLRQAGTGPVFPFAVMSTATSS